MLSSESTESTAVAALGLAGPLPHVGSCMGEAPTILTVACCPRACPMRDGVRSRMFPDRVCVVHVCSTGRVHGEE